MASTLVLMDCPGGRAPPLHIVNNLLASTLVLMDCPGGLPIPGDYGAMVKLQPLF